MYKIQPMISVCVDHRKCCQQRVTFASLSHKSVRPHHIYGLKGHIFREAWTRRSATSDMRRHRKRLTYLLTYLRLQYCERNAESYCACALQRYRTWIYYGISFVLLSLWYCLSNRLKLLKPSSSYARSCATADGPRDALCQSKSCPLLHSHRNNTHTHTHARTHAHTHTHTFNGLCPGLPMWAGTRKVKPIWILLKQETVSGRDISCAICKSAPRSRQITTPSPHHSVFTGRMPFLPPNQQRQSTEAIGTNCTTNPQLIAVIELEANGWPTCSKQSPRVDRRGCRQQTRPSTSFCWQRDRLAVARTFKSRVWDKVPEKVPLLKILKFPYNTVWDRCKKPPCQKPIYSSSHFDTILYGLVTDWRTDGQTNGQTHDNSKYAYRASIVSRGKMTYSRLHVEAQVSLNQTSWNPVKISSTGGAKCTAIGT